MFSMKADWKPWKGSF